MTKKNHSRIDAGLKSRVQKLKALANPGRLKVIACLAEAASPLSPKEMQARLGISGPTLSHYLERLEGVEMVTRERDGAEVHCRSVTRGIRELADYLGMVADRDSKERKI